MPCQGPTEKELKPYTIRETLYSMVLDIQSHSRRVGIMPLLDSEWESKIQDALRRVKDWDRSNDMFHSLTAHLCSLISDMDEGRKDVLLYNGRVKSCRWFANWWEEHQRIDVERMRRENHQRADKVAKAAYDRAYKEALAQENS